MKAYVLDLNPLIEMCFSNTVSQPVVCLFTFVTVFFKSRSCGLLMKFKFINLLFYDSYFCVLRDLCLIQSPMFSLKRFIILDFAVRPMTHFELGFVYGEDRRLKRIYSEKERGNGRCVMQQDCKRSRRNWKRSL